MTSADHGQAALPFTTGDRLSLLDLDDLDRPLWSDGDGDEPSTASPAVIASLGTRTRALAHTRPLHDLEASTTRWARRRPTTCWTCSSRWRGRSGSSS